MTLDGAVPRLLELGLVDPGSIVAGDLRLTSAARRSHGLRLERRAGPSWLVKQPDPTNSETFRTLRAESRFYAFCRERPAARELARLLPPTRAAPGHQDLVLVEWLEGATSLWRHYADVDDSVFPTAPLACLGRALGRLHATFSIPGLGSDEGLGALPECPPILCDAHWPEPSMLRYVSPANLEICRVLQADPTLQANVDRALAKWRLEAVIHGDLRQDNVLVVERNGELQVRLIDWEAVRRGDPAWDVGDVLRDSLHLWVVGMPTRPGLSVEERIAEAEIPLAALEPAHRAFWAQYTRAAGRRRAGHGDFLERAAGYCGARLIQTAWEASARASELAPREILLLQLAANILAAPVTAVRDLFGLPQHT